MDTFYAYRFMLRDKFKYLQTESFSGILELVAMLFSGRSNAENRTDVVSVRLQTFYVEQCNNITVMLNTGNLIKSNLVASSKKSPCASLIYQRAS